MKPLHPTPSELDALLEGKCSAIVRPIKPQPTEKGRIAFLVDQPSRFVDIRESQDFHGKSEIVNQWNSPFGSAGTILWCKETWQYDFKIEDESDSEKIFFHKHSWPNYPMNSGQYWLSPAVMPKAACRLWLEVVDVKVCRVQELTNEETIGFGHYPMPHRCEQSWPFDSHRDAFRVLWNREYGPRQLQLDKNPWIWYATVKRIDKPDNV
ncbi:hypothetical protein LZD49_07280 [Dyadobacter sp. CY261]|uniref:hypothetical protein n=1 Tax=Dyadobacter sp. CY261 TaxID=2907203 RepID=UPI001F290DBD|nr:hypothetical protein [Dyadobacter sp. CY261]MCF0070268.1 hypothetical protein [Dyadobacter sp. CY261]